MVVFIYCIVFFAFSAHLWAAEVLCFAPLHPCACIWRARQRHSWTRLLSTFSSFKYVGYRCISPVKAYCGFYCVNPGFGCNEHFVFCRPFCSACVCVGGSLALTHCQLTEQGLPIISVSDGKSYTYNADMCCW